MIVGMKTDEHSLRSQMGIGSESDCLLGQLERILEISDSVAGLNIEKSGGVAGGGGKWGDAIESQRLDILSVKKEVNLSVNEVGEMEVGRGGADLQ